MQGDFASSDDLTEQRLLQDLLATLETLASQAPPAARVTLEAQVTAQALKYLVCMQSMSDTHSATNGTSSSSHESCLDVMS